MEMSSLLVPFACVAAASPCEGVVVVVVIVSSEVAPVVPIFFVAAMWCIEPMGGAKLLVESVSGTDGHYNSKGQAPNSSSNILSLYSMCPINEHYRGYL